MALNTLPLLDVVSFSRSTKAWAFGSDGNYVEYPTGEPAIYYDNGETIGYHTHYSFTNLLFPADADSAGYPHQGGASMVSGFAGFTNAIRIDSQVVSPSYAYRRLTLQANTSYILHLVIKLNRDGKPSFQAVEGHSAPYDVGMNRATDAQVYERYCKEIQPRVWHCVFEYAVAGTVPSYFGLYKYQNSSFLNDTIDYQLFQVTEGYGWSPVFALSTTEATSVGGAYFYRNGAGIEEHTDLPKRLKGRYRFFSIGNNSTDGLGGVLSYQFSPSNYGNARVNYGPRRTSAAPPEHKYYHYGQAYNDAQQASRVFSFGLGHKPPIDETIEFSFDITRVGAQLTADGSTMTAWDVPQDFMTGSNRRAVVLGFGIASNRALNGVIIDFEFSNIVDPDN